MLKRHYNVFKRLRFAIAGFSVSFAVLLPGVSWYRQAVYSMTRASTREAATMLRYRFTMFRQQLSGELATQENARLLANLANKAATAVTSTGNHELVSPFDFVAVFHSDRKFLGGTRKLTSNKKFVALTSEAANKILPADIGFFDRVGVGQNASGLLMLDGRPLVVAVSRMTLTTAGEDAGFVVVGRWLDGRRLVATGEQAEAGVEMFNAPDEEHLPADVARALGIMRRGEDFAAETRQDGSGYVYVLFTDILERPAVVARLPWSSPWQKEGTGSFALFYITAIAAGVVTWRVLSNNDAKNKRKKRRFDGLSSLNVEALRTLVEAFPGFAFALNKNMEYIGFSSVLAGVIGQEPINFVGRAFGSVGSETEKGNFPEIFAGLRDPARWPRVADVEYSIEGLGKEYHFEGMAHHLATQDMLLVILHERRGEVNKLDRVVMQHAKELEAIRSRTITEVAAGLAHEVSRPLKVVGESIFGLRRLLFGGGSNEDLIENTLDQVDVMVGRISRLLSTALEMSSPRVDHEMVEENISVLVRDVIDIAGVLANASGVPLEVRMTSDDIKAFCKRGKIMQILTSLIYNSVEAIREQDERWIRLELTATPDAVSIAVTDSGRGIPEQVRVQLFKPFFSTKNGGGTRGFMGLSLSLAAGLASSHQGRLVYDTTSTNTKFILTWPKEQRADVEDSTSAAA